MSLEEVAVCTGHKVLMEIYNNILLIVGKLQGILYKQLRPHRVHFLNIIFMLINYIKLQNKNIQWTSHQKAKLDVYNNP